MVETIKLGSLYFDDHPVEYGSKYNGGVLEIGDTVLGMEIPWIKANGLYVAANTVCTNISWQDLDARKLISGRPVYIDGHPYLCRSLKVGSKRDDPNKWDDILAAVGEDNSLWHWKNVFFWGYESSHYEASHRALRGYYSARHWHHNSASLRYVRVGFRPALEPLVPNTLISDSLVGHSIRAYGTNGKLAVILTGITNYDLFLTPAPDAAPVPNCGWCCQQEDGTVVVDRSSVLITRSA